MQVTALQQGQLIKGDRDIPRPGSGQVLVRNLACGPMTFNPVGGLVMKDVPIRIMQFEFDQAELVQSIPGMSFGLGLPRKLSTAPSPLIYMTTFTAVIFTGCLSACTRNTTFLDTYFVLGSLSKPIDPNRRQQLR